MRGAIGFAGAREIEIAHDLVRCRPHRGQQSIQCSSLLVQLGEHARALEKLDLALEDIDRVSEPGRERVGAVGLDESVRILTLGQRYHTHRCSLPQQLVARAERRLEPGLVAVVEEKDVLRQLP